MLITKIRTLVAEARLSASREGRAKRRGAISGTIVLLDGERENAMATRDRSHDVFGETPGAAAATHGARFELHRASADRLFRTAERRTAYRSLSSAATARRREPAHVDETRSALRRPHAAQLGAKR